MKYLLNKLAILIIFSLMLALVPDFSLYANYENTFLIQTKNGSQIFEKDTNIKNILNISDSPAFADVFRVQTSYTLSQFTSKYANDLVYAELEKKMVASTVLVNDPGFSVVPNNIDRQWGLWKAKFPEAWEKTKGASSTVIAVIDTGIDATHEDLALGQIGPGFDFTTRSLIPFAVNSDDNGHGTLVAGVIAATPNNFRGITGANWNATIMPIKALDSKGAGNSGDVAASIIYAADNGASIINLSLGGIGFANDTTLSNSIRYAFEKGAVIISAAGNDMAKTGGNIDLEPVFPICNDNGQNMIIGVVATDINDQKADFSNYGKVCVDVSAPGRRILSTISIDPTTNQRTPNTYAYASGTSLAAPFVSATAALIKAAYPNANNKEIRDRILKSTEPIDVNNLFQCGGGSCAGMIGTGRINAEKALDANLIPAVADGSLLQSDTSNQVYLISGGQKLPVSQFVLQQRFGGVAPTTVPSYQLDAIPTGQYALPSEGTVVKTQSNQTLYMIVGNFKRPITYQIYQQRKIQSGPIYVVSDQEMNTWVVGTFLPPEEGTLVKTFRNPTVYWVVDGLLHPINYTFWIERGLNIFPILTISDNDLKGFALGNAYIR